jgi:hypothetical protein
MLYLGDLRFIMKAGPDTPNVLVIRASSMRRHIGGRCSVEKLKAVISRLVTWRVITYADFGYDTFIIRLASPRGFTPEKAFEANQPAIPHNSFNLPALLKSEGDVPITKYKHRQLSLILASGERKLRGAKADTGGIYE